MKKRGVSPLLGGFMAAIVLVLCSVSAQAFPSWIGVYGGYQRHNGINPGTYTILMNQDYYGLHAEVGIQVNGGGYGTHAMTYAGNADGNSIWQYEVGIAYSSNDYVQFYFHGWDDWGGNIYDNNSGWNYSFTAGAAQLDWVGNSSLPAIIAGRDAWVSTESWPRDAGTEAFSLFALDGSWGGSSLAYNGVSGANDSWRGSLGRFSVSSEVQVVLGVDDEAGYTLYDNNNGSNYAFTVQQGSAAQWLGNAYHWPTNGALTSTNDLWLNLFAYPSQTVVQADALYAVNGMIWELSALSYWQMEGNDEWWHVNLGLMPPGATIHYLFEVEDGSGAWNLIPSNGIPCSASVASSTNDTDSDNLPDDWEQFWFSSLANSATDNPDSDGLSSLPVDNFIEYCIGSDPDFSNAVANLRLLWYPSRPFKGGYMKLSAHIATNEALYASSITATIDQNDGSGAQSITLPLASNGRFENSLLISASASEISILRLTANGSTNDNHTLGWTIPLRPLAQGEAADSDSDGLPDEWETEYNLDPLDDGTLNSDNGSSGDPDGDNLSNAQERTKITLPREHEMDWQDNDGDLIPNIVEAAYYTDPDDALDFPEPTITVFHDETDITARIETAVQQAANGYPIVKLAPGIYYRNGTVEIIKITNTENLTLVGAHPGTQFQVVLDLQGYNRGITIDSSTNCYIAGIAIKNGNMGQYGVGHGIAAYWSRVILDGCLLENCGSESGLGGSLYAVDSYSTLANCVIQDAANGPAIVQFGGRLWLKHCSLLGNYTGIDALDASSTAVENSILWNSDSQLGLDMSAENNVADSCIRDGFEEGSNILDTDPGLIHEWRMPAESSCRNYADRQITCDLDGETRPAELADIGADQWRDSDSDSQPDWWEIGWGFDPGNPDDAAEDEDGDGLANLMEYQHETFPDTGDSDGDGMLDGWEVQYALDPLNAMDADEDLDEDGYSNQVEFLMNSPPDNPAWNAAQLIDALMSCRADGEASLKVTIDDSENCGGSNDQIQNRHDTFSVPELLDIGYIINDTVTGSVEDQDEGVDKVSVEAYEDIPFFEGNENGNGCQMYPKTETMPIVVFSQSEITLRYNTVDALFHENAYAEIINATYVDTVEVDLEIRTSGWRTPNIPTSFNTTYWYGDPYPPYDFYRVLDFYEDLDNGSCGHMEAKASITPVTIDTSKIQFRWMQYFLEDKKWESPTVSTTESGWDELTEAVQDKIPHLSADESELCLFFRDDPGPPSTGLTCSQFRRRMNYLTWVQCNVDGAGWKDCSPKKNWYIRYDRVKGEDNKWYPDPNAPSGGNSIAEGTTSTTWE